ncbi:MAG: hypothetical protein KDN05_05370 [Verrucomicrobiae bacterium]|nr:hypothetical protein [Verrucomicrobiae bacterium]
MKTKAHRIAALLGVITLVGTGARLAAQPEQGRPPTGRDLSVRQEEAIKKDVRMALEAETLRRDGKPGEAREVESARRPGAAREARVAEFRRLVAGEPGRPGAARESTPEAGKIEHLQQAARHLEAAGFREQSERVRRVVAEMTAAQHAKERKVKQLREMERAPKVDRPDGPPPFVVEMQRELTSLRGEITELRQALRKLNAKIDEPAKPVAKPKKKDRPAKKNKKRETKEG